MTKYLLMFKVQQVTAHCTVLFNTLSKTNGFPITKTVAMLPLVKPISKEDSQYIDALDKKDRALDMRDLADIDKTIEVVGKNKDIKCRT